MHFRSGFTPPPTPRSSSVGPSFAPQAEPRHSGQLGLGGCADPAGGRQEGLARRRVLCHQTTREVICGKIQNWRQRQRLCVGVCFHTSKSCYRDRCQNASSSSQLKRYRKLHHQRIGPKVSSCLGVASETAVGLIRFRPKEKTVCMSLSSRRNE